MKMKYEPEYALVYYCFFHTETVKSINKLISLLQIAVNTKIHVQLMASDSFIVYIKLYYIKKVEWMYIAVLSRTVVDSDWRFDNGVIIIFMISYCQNISPCQQQSQ